MEEKLWQEEDRRVEKVLRYKLMIKLTNLNSDDEFKKLLKLKKIHSNCFTVYFGKIYSGETNKNFKISFVEKKK